MKAKQNIFVAESRESNKQSFTSLCIYFFDNPLAKIRANLAVNRWTQLAPQLNLVNRDLCLQQNYSDQLTETKRICEQSILRFMCHSHSSVSSSNVNLCNVHDSIYDLFTVTLEPFIRASTATQPFSTRNNIRVRIVYAMFWMESNGWSQSILLICDIKSYKTFTVCYCILVSWARAWSDEIDIVAIFLWNCAGGKCFVVNDWYQFKTCLP